MTWKCGRRRQRHGTWIANLLHKTIKRTQPSHVRSRSSHFNSSHPKVIDRLVNRNECYLGGKSPEGD